MIKLNKWQKVLIVLNVILLVWILTTTDGKNNGYELYAEEPRVDVWKIYNSETTNITYLYAMKGEYARVEEDEDGICYYIKDAGISVIVDEDGVSIYIDSSYIDTESEIDRTYFIDEEGDWYLEKKTYEKQ